MIFETMDGIELRARIKRLGLTFRAAAPLLGLSVPGLHHQLRGEASVSRQTEMLLEQLEREQAHQPRPPRPRKPPIAAVLALALFGAGFFAYAGERTVSEATPAFDWDLYHDRQDACRESEKVYP